MSNAAQGALAKLYVMDGTGSLSYENAAGAEAYEFLTESLQASQAVLDTNGIRGTRSVPHERTRLGPRAVGGTITMNPGPAQLDKWLPRILGAAAVGDTFGLGETFTKFGIYVDRVTDRHEYTDCVVTSATFRAQPGQLLEMSLDIVGGDENIGKTAPGTPPTLGITSAHAPYVFHDACGGLALPSTSSAESFDIEFGIDNAMDARFVNCVTTTSIMPSDRVVSAALTVPFDSDHKQLYRVTPRGLPGSATFTNGSFSTKFDFASLDGPDVSPMVQGKQEIVLRLDYRARQSGTTLELVVTNVAT